MDTSRNAFLSYSQHSNAFKAQRQKIVIQFRQKVVTHNSLADPELLESLYRLFGFSRNGPVSSVGLKRGNLDISNGSRRTSEPNQIDSQLVLALNGSF